MYKNQVESINCLSQDSKEIEIYMNMKFKSKHPFYYCGIIRVNEFLTINNKIFTRGSK
jgi:hypothetical protein